VLVYRPFTYVMPITLGFVAYIYWRRKTAWLDSAPPLDARFTGPTWQSADAV
jgi:hypothetical protein